MMLPVTTMFAIYRYSLQLYAWIVLFSDPKPLTLQVNSSAPYQFSKRGHETHADDLIHKMTKEVGFGFGLQCFDTNTFEVLDIGLLMVPQLVISCQC